MYYPTKSNSSFYIDTHTAESSPYKQHTHNPFPSPPSPKSTQTPKPVTNKVTPQSWESIKSPAAAFLSGFASSPTNKVEEEGDEIDDYILETVIGYGGFSVVRKGFRISDGKKVAIKVIQKETDEVRLENELAIWRSINHKNIVCLEKVVETDGAFYIICDYCENGNLLDRLKHSISEKETRFIFGQICEGLEYLHCEKRICHKDLKLDNILLDEDHNVKLCDFGLAMHEQPASHTHSMDDPDGNSTMAAGSLPYTAPEQIKSSAAIGSLSTDIWSLGIILYALVVGKFPFSDDYDLRLQQKILSGEYDMPENLSLELRDLLKSCLQLDPNARSTIQNIRVSPWLSL